MRSRFIMVLGTFGLSLLLYFDRIAISASKDGITSDLGLTDIQFGWVLSIFALGYALFQTPSGILADRYGPRAILSAVVVFWSAFTALTGAAMNYAVLLLSRFLFGVGEAGAFPGISRSVFSWIPLRERGIVNGINFSGSRVGGAAALVLMPWFIDLFGWRMSFYILGAIGIGWALFWWYWFRDTPEEKSDVSEDELAYIQEHRQQPSKDEGEILPVTLGEMFRSRNMWIAMAQYICSNFTAFFTLSWLFPYIKDSYDLTLQNAGFYAALPLLGGAFGNWFSGWLVDRIYARGHWSLSRKLPAMFGFVLAAMGLLLSVQQDGVMGAVFWLTVAVFGVDMILSPSWSFCVDIGRKSAGAVSGTMNMAGNLGSFTTALAFPYLAAWFGGYEPFFYLAAGLNLLAAFLWFFAKPEEAIRSRRVLV